MKRFFPFLFAAAALFAFDALLFRTELYVPEPDSYAGAVDQLVYRESHRISDPRRDVVVVGDSRMSEGLSAKIATAAAANSGLRFINAGVPSSNLRCWYYLLRELDPKAERYRAVVIPLDDYYDEDGAWDWADSGHDVHVVVRLIRFRDVWEFAGSFRALPAKLEALRAVLLKGTVLNRDVRAFLSRPRERLRKAAAARRHSGEWIDGYEGNAATLAGASVDWAARRIAFPARVSAAQRENIRETVFRQHLPQTGNYAAYRRLWLGRIADRYRGRGTQVVLIRIPRTPFPDPHYGSQSPGVVRELSRCDGVIVCDAGWFAPLERPEFFFDSLHVNAAGRREFSAMLARQMESALADAVSHR